MSPITALKSRHLLGLENITAEEIELIMHQARAMKEICSRPIKKAPPLRGRTVINLFFESSTRTRSSFEIAAKRLSADAVNFSASASSLSKGETLIDTTQTINAMGPDLLIVRHPSAGAPKMLTRYVDAPIINAGDGKHEHPTQALLDMFTVSERLGKLDGLEVAIIGDITHSRVARSNIYGFTRMGSKVRICGPPTMLPIEAEKLGATVCRKMEDAVVGADVIMMLRVQLERQKGPALFPSLREYNRFWGLNRARVELAKPGALIMHPGPVNRGVEINLDVMQGEYSVILEQVAAGVAVRMALIYMLAGGSEASREERI